MANRKEVTNGTLVTQVLNTWLHNTKSDLNLVEMAERIGIDKSKYCFMSQLRHGRMKVPIGRINLLAETLQQDPRHLLVAALQVYYPEVKDALEKSGLLNDDYYQVVSELENAKVVNGLLTNLQTSVEGTSRKSEQK